jgi:predicted O-linked N-acetylglucosamine transferase (SPINDLY family)
MPVNRISRWVTRWLDRRGLGAVADTLDQAAAAEGSVDALHDMARRAIARGEPGMALARLQDALALAPTDASLLCSQGAAYRNNGEFALARRSYEQALVLKPDYLQVLSNLGEWCLAKGLNEEALEWLDKAIAISPHFFEARVNKTAALFELSRFEDARALAQQLVDEEPTRPEAHLNQGNLLVHTGKSKLGIKHYKKALELQPGYAEAHYNLASLLGTKGDIAATISYLERRLKERGDSVQNLAMLAVARQAAGHLAQSEALCRRILERQPDNVTALVTLGSCLSIGGNSASASALYEQVFEHDPSQAAMGSNILFEHNNIHSTSRSKLFEMHRAWAERFEAPLERQNDFSQRNRDPCRKLKIGYVSGDFVRHPVGFLLRDILRHHNAEQFEVHCFSMAIRPEEVLPELREAADAWEDIFFLTDDELVALIEKAEIDILIDLSGHTAFNRLLVFARRPAPVQVEWIGYFHSTGMSSIDYFITDPHTTPIDNGQLFTEIPVYMPHTRFCYGPPGYVPEVVSAPFAKNGFITFGSFNRLPKMTDAVISAWSRIVLGVPGSRLVIKSGALSEDVVKERLLARFSQHGVTPERLELREGSPHNDMLGEYGDIDLALDSFPFNGGMTSLEALWMGVPVVTVAGDTVVSRQTVSALANLGLEDELAFDSVEAYVQGAVTLAANPARLCELRAELRARMAASPLRDDTRFTQDLERLLRNMWGAWCQGRKLESNSVAAPV